MDLEKFAAAAKRAELPYPPCHAIPYEWDSFYMHKQEWADAQFLAENFNALLSELVAARAEAAALRGVLAIPPGVEAAMRDIDSMTVAGAPLWYVKSVEAIMKHLRQLQAAQAERQQPIDAAWLKGIGFKLTKGRPNPESKVRWIAIGKDEDDVSLVVFPCERGWMVMREELGEFDNKETYLTTASTRGQLLDLLAGLRGGSG